MKPLRIYAFQSHDFDEKGLLKVLDKDPLEYEFIIEPTDYKGVKWQEYRPGKLGIDRTWIAEKCAEVNRVYSTDIDIVAFFCGDDEWQDGEDDILGWRLAGFYSGYSVIIAKKPKPAYHELEHCLDDIVKAELGIDIAPILGVSDFDEDIVHAKATGYKEYQYAETNKKLIPYINRAIEMRRKVSPWLIRLVRELRQFVISLKKYDEAIKEQTKQTTPILSNRERLYFVARGALGSEMSPKDVAPDELGCVESVSNVIKKVLPDFPVITYTPTMLAYLKKDKRFEGTLEPEAGNIIISPTTGKQIGHIGIHLGGGRIASNTSKNGLWEDNYSITSWVNSFRKKKGLPIYYFKVK